jgi:Family of unknown function (DUF695)/Regulator of ribonuclease activity B
MGSTEVPRTNAWVAGPCLLPGGEPAFLKFTQEYAGRPRDGYVKQATVQLKLLAPDADGLVGHEENKRLQAIERSLVAVGGDQVCYVGFSTHSGLRRYLFYVKSTEWLRTWGNEHSEEVSRRTITVWVKDEPRWTTYQQLLGLAAEAMSDMRVVMKIHELDVDMTRPRRIDWTLLFPDERQAHAAVAEIGAADSEITLTLTSHGTQTICRASKVDVLNLGFMLHFNALMRSIASAAGGQFDGWGAEIDARNPAS